jgi:hypothetical protein
MQEEKRTPRIYIEETVVNSRKDLFLKCLILFP